jgi:hypothetical protein
MVPDVQVKSQWLLVMIFVVLVLHTVPKSEVNEFQEDSKKN